MGGHGPMGGPGMGGFGHGPMGGPHMGMHGGPGMPPPPPGFHHHHHRGCLGGCLTPFVFMLVIAAVTVAAIVIL